MLEPQLSGTRKRQRPEQPQPNEIPASKKQRRSHPSRSQSPAAFWDNLSKIWLTKRALRELDRRNTQAATHTAHYLRCCDLRTLEDVKRFDDALYSQSRQRGSMNPPGTEPTTNTTKTKSTGVYDFAFELHLVDNAVYPHGYRYLDNSVPAKPNDWRAINQILAQRRPSLSPSKFTDEEFERFAQTDADAVGEKKVLELVIPTIEGNITNAGYRLRGIPFDNLVPLTDRALKPGNPDIYYGARPEQLARKVRDELGGQIIPSTEDNLPMAPNFFLTAKGPDGSLAVAGRQACYDGALGARGMHSLQSYGRDEPVSDDNAYTITSTYHGGTLKMYTSHRTQPTSAGGRPEYYMTQLRSFAMTDTAETFRQGARAYRNLRDWTKEQRDEAIQQANERANPVAAEAPALAVCPSNKNRPRSCDLS
ncbi:uncharacterized protein BDZ99DRAFT_483960 [Mytilinidion resinicola]|uniref:Uncharacterized protein n=1 Tax=Mytilinidion resinicola TaxID=574789 RepID=A0A6A6Z6X7_9PEZI|nr:uncharacterized protein BDZ99DRAFT_483960 [Mytilinidion resinicola]KAF2816851.1 hypothetical protein BDZ99DRAFT_483960 [Mytilinidion resinicola]